MVRHSLITLVLALGGSAAAFADAPSGTPCFEAASWPGADRLFRTSRHWLGADGAYSVPLGDGRVLWLFGDTWIDPAGRGSRRGARMIRNSVAIQEGADPSTARISFHWRTAADGGPADFWARSDHQWYWPGHGIRLGHSLVLFFFRERAVPTPPGFRATGWDAVLIDNPDDAPPAWRVRWLDAPPGPPAVIVSGGVMRHEGYVYALAATDPAGESPVFLARWPAVALEAGALSAAEWWSGDPGRWTRDPVESPRAIFEGGQTELSLHRDPASGRFLVVQSVGYGSAAIGIRHATRLTGPWSNPVIVFRPPEADREHSMIYAGKAQPHLEGADLVVTYATNSFEFDDHFTEPALYYPGFVRLSRCGNDGTGRGVEPGN